MIIQMPVIAIQSEFVSGAQTLFDSRSKKANSTKFCAKTRINFKNTPMQMWPL